MLLEKEIILRIKAILTYKIIRHSKHSMLILKMNVNDIYIYIYMQQIEKSKFKRERRKTDRQRVGGEAHSKL